MKKARRTTQTVILKSVLGVGIGFVFLAPPALKNVGQKSDHLQKKGDLYSTCIVEPHRAHVFFYLPHHA